MFREISVLFALLFFSALTWADLYGFVDENGRAHMSTTQIDERYKLFQRSAATATATTKKQTVVVVEPRMPKVSKRTIKLYNKQIVKVAKKYGIEPALVHAVILAESQYNADAISRRGAIGLMQLMPATAERYKVADSFDANQNIRGGAQYLRDLIKLFDGDLELAVAAYNAGEGAVIRNGRKIPPYPETVKYVPKVMAYYRKYQQRI
jgi:soluble lytic murein transglycosylase-like protein